MSGAPLVACLGIISSLSHDPIRYAQLGLTVAALAWVPGNTAKLIAMLVIWALTFRRVSRGEATLFVAASCLFSGMNVGALQQGVFQFRDPDFLGMPVWEFVMWGFYVLHLIRVVGGPAPPGPLWTPLGLAIAFAIPFSTIPDATWLLVSTGLILAAALSFYHERLDLLYAGYMVLVGALIEYVGVWSGQWGYPGAPAGGVPLWFITMWGGVGLFTRRLVLPILRRYEPQPS